MDIVSLLDTLLTSVFKAEKDFFDNPKNFSNLEASVKSSTEAFAASFLGAILSEMDQAMDPGTVPGVHYKGGKWRPGMSTLQSIVCQRNIWYDIHVCGKRDKFGGIFIWIMA